MPKTESMAVFSWSMQIIGRSAGRSVVAAAAYRAGERLHDERTGTTHDYSRRSGVEHTEILFPQNSPEWTHGLDRESLWNAVEAGEKRKDAQTARELRFAIPREIAPEDRVELVRNYLNQSFAQRGMVIDYAIHNKVASDGKEQPHVHALITLRPLADGGFGLKSRHEWVPDPSGLKHPDGRPVMVESNSNSWNSVVYFEQCRENWEHIANAALARAGSEERLDRRSLLAQGLARMPEPALRLANYLTDLYGCMRERFGQFQMARHYRAVEDRAKAAFAKLDQAPMTPATAQQAKGIAERYFGWFERQLERLAVASPDAQRGHTSDIGGRGPAEPRSPPTLGMER